MRASDDMEEMRWSGVMVIRLEPPQSTLSASRTHVYLNLVLPLEL